jgi:hypothetical protein
VIIEVGKRGKRQINALREGRGPIMEDIDAAVGRLRSSGDIAGDAQVVVVIVKQRPRDDASSWCWW